VRFDGLATPEERDSFGQRAAWKEKDGRTVVEIEATNQEALLRHVLSLGDRAEILAPRSLREKARKALASLARRLA
jgi:proteasome accessory factor B